MAKLINIEAREHYERRLSMEAAQDDAYTKSTGYREVSKYTGAWDDLYSEAQTALGGGGGEWRVSCELERVESGLAELRITRERFEVGSGSGGGGGGGDGGDGAGTVGTEENPTYTCNTYCVADPLLTHRKFKDLDESELRALNALLNGRDEEDTLSAEGSNTGGMKIKDMIKSQNGKLAMDKIKHGIHSYMCPYCEATASWKGTANRYEVGQILSSIPGFTTPGGRDWMVTRVEKSKVGNEIWQSASFMLSGIGDKWDRDLYVL